MITSVYEYKNSYSDERHFRVMHESNRMYEYFEEPPKTVLEFIKDKNPVFKEIPFYNETGYFYW